MPTTLIKSRTMDGKCWPLKAKPQVNAFVCRAGRFWPKQGCDGSGQNCQVGQSIAPCGRTGCDPPAETKVEFFFPAMNQGSGGKSEAIEQDSEFKKFLFSLVRHQSRRWILPSRENCSQPPARIVQNH